MESTDSDDAPREDLPVPVGIPRFHVSQEDLETLERLLPKLMWDSAMPGAWTTQQRVQWAKVQKIVSDIRWDGGPPLEVHRVE